MTDNQDMDTESLIFRQIDRVMRTASMDLETLTDGQGVERAMDPKTWSHKVIFSCEFLHAFLRPSMTEEKYRRIINKAYDSDEEAESTPWQRIRSGKRMFREDIKHLHENNMVFQESSEMVIEDQSETEGVEPEGSKVEEVIE